MFQFWYNVTLQIDVKIGSESNLIFNYKLIKIRKSVFYWMFKLFRKLINSDVPFLNFLLSSLYTEA